MPFICKKIIILCIIAEEAVIGAVSSHQRSDPGAGAEAEVRREESAGADTEVQYGFRVLFFYSSIPYL